MNVFQRPEIEMNEIIKKSLHEGAYYRIYIYIVQFNGDSNSV